MTSFFAIFCGKLFLRSRIAVFAPTDDFNFLSSMMWFKEEDLKVDTAVGSVNRHKWYLTQELKSVRYSQER